MPHFQTSVAEELLLTVELCYLCVCLCLTLLLISQPVENLLFFAFALSTQSDLLKLELFFSTVP